MQEQIALGLRAVPQKYSSVRPLPWIALPNQVKFSGKVAFFTIQIDCYTFATCQCL